MCLVKQPNRSFTCILTSQAALFYSKLVTIMQDVRRYICILYPMQRALCEGTDWIGLPAKLKWINTGYFILQITFFDQPSTTQQQHVFIYQSYHGKNKEFALFLNCWKKSFFGWSWPCFVWFSHSPPLLLLPLSRRTIWIWTLRPVVQMD